MKSKKKLVVQDNKELKRGNKLLLCKRQDSVREGKREREVVIESK